MVNNFSSSLKSNSNKILLIFIFFIVLLIAGPLASIVISGDSLQFVALLLCISMAPFIFVKPIRGLFLLPIFGYIVPENLHYSGISPGLAFSAITIISSIIYILGGKSKPSFSWVWILIMIMFTNMYLIHHAHLLSFIQGVAPYIIFSFVVKTESEARLVLKYWIGAFAIFSLLHILRGGVLYSDESLLQGLAAVRNEELGGHNPNLLGWLSLLYLAVAPTIALTSITKKEKKRWWYFYFGIVLMIIFSFSRAAMSGLIATFILLFIFLGKSFGNYKKILFPTFSGFALLYVVWTLAVNQGIMDPGRAMNVSSQTPELNLRIAMIIGGWQLVAENPFGWGQINVSTHSGFTKAALEFGLSYFFLWVIAFGYLIKTSFSISIKHIDSNKRILATGIMVSGLVGVMQGIFGATIFDAAYAQVFWLFIGYIQLMKKDEKHIIIS